MPAEAGVPLRGDPRCDVIGVIVALSLEKRSLERVVRIADGIIVLQSGPGPERAAAAARDAIRRGATALLSWGLAGGLVASAGPGAVVVPERVVCGDGRELAVEPSWRRDVIARLGGEFDLPDGPLVSVERVLATPAAKTCSASVSGAIAADMESGAVGGVAADAGVPFLAVRVVADAAEDVLPRNVEDWVAPDGAPRLAPLWRTLLAPRELGRLALLARRSRAAERVLAAVASRAIAPSAGSVGSAASTT